MNRLVGGLLSLSRVQADERVRPMAQIDLRTVFKPRYSTLSHWS
jgi:two-component system phosphate regulon sensor histidine kinase PhoR